MTTQFRGTAAVSLEGIQRNWSQSNGWESTYTYKGTWANIELAKNNTAYVGNASRVDVNQEAGGYGTMQVTFAAIDNESASTTANTPESDMWELKPSKVQRNVWEDPYFDDLDDSLIVYVQPGNTDAQNETAYLASPNYRGTKYRIRAAVDAYLSEVQANIEAGNTDESKVNLHTKLKEWNGGSAYTGLVGSQKQKALNLVNLLLNGKDTDEHTRYVLRNIRILPGNTSTQVAHEQVGKQWTTAALSNYIFATAIPSITRHTMLGDLNAVFGSSYWLKEAPLLSDVHGGKVELVQEWTNYELGEKSTLLHNVYG
ncbi:MAG: hypothetical protein CBD27_09735 [Rhodospirillaceae bacterium TMED167]|nr:MAG: hypothetical protein CBD27_09735 [Rhodospirillaceae bacterium TMED167]